MAMLMQGEQTALMYAVMIGDEEIFDLLIEHGADDGCMWNTLAVDC